MYATQFICYLFRIMKLEKREYSELKLDDKVILQNHNKSMGAVIFKGKTGDLVCWETLSGDEVWESITYLKEKKTKLLGVII